MATRSTRAVAKPLPQTSAVADLVQSVKQHKNFKQLASYSVQCLAKAIMPPSVGWEVRMKEAFDAGALEAITQVGGPSARAFDTMGSSGVVWLRRCVRSGLACLAWPDSSLTRRAIVLPSSAAPL